MALGFGDHRRNCFLKKLRPAWRKKVKMCHDITRSNPTWLQTLNVKFIRRKILNMEIISILQKFDYADSKQFSAMLSLLIVVESKIVGRKFSSPMELGSENEELDVECFSIRISFSTMRNSHALKLPGVRPTLKARTQ